MNVRRLAAAAALACLPLLAGCLDQRSCTEIYAPDGLGLTFAPPPATAGEWSLEITGDVSVSCALTLPTTGGGDGRFSCVAPEPVTTELDVATDGGSIEGLVIFEAAPASIEIVLNRDGVDAAVASVEPDYEVSEPNGAGCGERRWAEIEVAVTDP